MAGNSFGDVFRITTFGESHGKAIQPAFIRDQDLSKVAMSQCWVLLVQAASHPVECQQVSLLAVFVPIQAIAAVQAVARHPQFIASEKKGGSGVGELEQDRQFRPFDAFLRGTEKAADIVAAEQIPQPLPGLVAIATSNPPKPLAESRGRDLLFGKERRQCPAEGVVHHRVEGIALQPGTGIIPKLSG